MTSLLAALLVLVAAGFRRRRATRIRLRLGVAGPAWPRLRRPRVVARRRSQRREAKQVSASMPDVIDLLAVAVAAGLNVRLAVQSLARRSPPGVIAASLARVVAEVAAGARLGDALERLPEMLGEQVRPLVAALLDAERYGAVLGPSLERLSDDARRVRQRAAEEAARRIPVKLLFPLVTCILPAFGLLTVAPLIAGGLRALRL